MKHLLSINDLTDQELDDLTRPVRELPASPCRLRGTMSCVFEQPSLRTASGFAAAAVELGLTPIFLDVRGHPVRQHVELEDELQQLSFSSKLVVVRSGAALQRGFLAACRTSVVNAGDGDNEHPSQTLVDMTAIRKLLPKGGTVVQMGNLRGHRTQHSLSLALQRTGYKPLQVSPPGLAMPGSFAGHTEAVETSSTAEVDEALSRADVVYLTPVKYWDTPDLRNPAFELNVERALKVLKPTAKVLHPLPRAEELSPNIDSTSFNGYHDQLHSALAVRIRLLRHILGA